MRGDCMKPMKPTPTLHDVAQLANVSTATVSRCLNLPDQVTERTREKVMQAISTLGYAPNFGARAMAARRTNTIGAIIPTMENAIFARGLQAFQEQLREDGFTMLVASSSYRPDIEQEQIRSLVARGADALLLIGHERDPDIYRFLDAQGVPALVVWAYDPRIDRPAVGFDNRVAMHDLAKEVLDRGHRRLALISAQVAMNDRARERLHGVRDAMQQHGLDPDSLIVVETPYTIENGAAAFDDLMRLQDRPTAVMCGNDVLAAGALGRARELGIRVPVDVSITGYDDIELAQVVYPPLATVHVPHREMGRRAAQILVAMVKDGQVVAPVRLDAVVVLRASLGDAPGP